MREYSEYKDSHISWIGKVPEHWEVKRLKNSTILNPSFSAQITPETIVAYMPMECLRNGVIQERVAPYKDVASYTPFQDDDIVMAKVTPCFENGNIAVAKNLQSGYGFGTSEIFVIRCQKDTNNQYVFYYLQSDYIKNLGISSMTGTGGLKRVNPYVLNNSVLLFPPKTEQQHIVSFLDKKTAKIDEYIDKKNKEIEALKEWKKALIAHVVTKGLNTNAKMKKFKSLLSDETPSHWKIVRNKNIFESHYEAVSSRKNIPLLSLTTEGVLLRDVSTGKGKFPKDFEMYNVVYPNNIIFCLFDLDETPRTVGLCYNYGMITNAYTTFKIKDSVLPEYITNYYLAVDNIKALRPYYSGLRKVVQSNRFNSIQIPLPPIEEQQEIVEYIDAATTKADKMIVELTNHVESMKEYKQRLIADVVTGKINVQP